MATSNPLNVAPISFVATSAIGKNLLAALDGTTANQVVVPSGITILCVGATMESAAAGAVVPVQVYGVAKLTAKAAINANAQVMPDSGGSGKVLTASGATARTVGVALEAAGADGDVISVLLLPAGNGPANA